MLDLSRAEWRTSSHSGGGNQCVQLARFGDLLAIQDSKNPDGEPIILPVSAARAAIRSAPRR